MADLTTNTIPRATGATQVDDGTLTDDGIGGLLVAGNGIDLTLKGSPGAAGTGTYGGKLFFTGGDAATGANYGGHTYLTGGASAGGYGGYAYVTGGAGLTNGGNTRLVGGASDNGPGGDARVEGGVGTAGGEVRITGGTSNGTDVKGANVVVAAGNGNAGNADGGDLILGGGSKAGTGRAGVVFISDSRAIADLPASPTAGMFAVVNDALSPVVGTAVADGGMASAVVCYGGTQWTVVSI